MRKKSLNEAPARNETLFSSKVRKIYIISFFFGKFSHFHLHDEEWKVTEKINIFSMKSLLIFITAGCSWFYSYSIELNFNCWLKRESSNFMDFSTVTATRLSIWLEGASEEWMARTKRKRRSCKRYGNLHYNWIMPFSASHSSLLFFGNNFRISFSAIFLEHFSIISHSSLLLHSLEANRSLSFMLPCLP